VSEALITKYRPTKFSEVIGQDIVVKSFEHVLKVDAAPAFLFSGPSGVGKTTLARLGAQALGCLPGSADLIEVDGATNTGIEAMRELMDGLIYRPLGDGAVKAVIVDEAQALSKQAITSLLKILEEPPSWVYWFLCTTEPTKIPKAIETRCLRYNLNPVHTSDLTDLLESTDEAKKVPGEIIKLCAREAHGSPRQALANLGVCMMAKDRQEAAELLRSAADVPQAFELAQLLVRGTGWVPVCDLLDGLKDTSPESVRHVIRAYVTKVVLNAKSDKETMRALAILEQFASPFHPNDGLAPLVLACGKLLLA
jgi:DNA polymerase III gamma/tau subunit